MDLEFISPLVRVFPCERPMLKATEASMHWYIGTPKNAAELHTHLLSQDPLWQSPAGKRNAKRARPKTVIKIGSPEGKALCPEKILYSSTRVTCLLGGKTHHQEYRFSRVRDGSYDRLSQI